MNEIKWINLSDFQNQIQQLINQHNLVFVEFEYYVDLKRMLHIVKELYSNYTTPLFEADWLETYKEQMSPTQREMLDIE